MAAILTASVNPVGVWGKGQTGETVISWRTGNASPARLYLQTAYGASPPPAMLFDGDPALGDTSGTKALTVTVGPTYKLTLRQVSDNSVLAMLLVTVDDLVQDYIDRAAQEAQFSGFVTTQVISNIVITAGADDAHITFKTSQPTIPIVTATAPDGTSAGAVFPVLNGMQTDHDVTLGVATPLAQQTTFTLTITAPGHAGFPSHDVTKVAKTTFTTGNRSATAAIGGLAMLQGSDEFQFEFAVGNADIPGDLNWPWDTGSEHFDDVDRRHVVHYPIDISILAPRHLWVGALAVQGTRSTSINPDANASPTGYDEHDGTAVAWANTVYDITHGGTQNIDLLCRPADISFEAVGKLTATVTPGTAPKLPKPQSSVSKSGLRLLSGGSKAALTGPRNKTMTVARAADGAVYRRIKPLSRRAADGEGWVAVTPPVEGAVTAIATGENRIACFAHDAEGVVLRADATGDHPAREWHRIGGRFAGAIDAVVVGEAIVLLAQDREGTIFERRVPLASHVEAGEWHKIGAARLGTLTVRALGGNDFAVFALDQDGRAIYRRRDAWHPIAGATGITLGVSEIAHDAVGLVLIDDAGRMHSLVWRGFPDREPGRWTAEGDFQQWLVRPLDAPADTREAAAAE